MYNLRFENLVMFNKRLHKSCYLQSKKNDSNEIECPVYIINWSFDLL